MLKVIQIGITFADATGNLVPDCPTWQFNFQCDLECVPTVLRCRVLHVSPSHVHLWLAQQARHVCTRLY